MASAPKLGLAHAARGEVRRNSSVWLEEARRWKIEYSDRAMEEIRATAARGLNGIGRGGVEVGGLLLGSRLGNFLRVVDWRPIACEHAMGPAFLLSQKDEDVLRAQLESVLQEESTRDYQVLGCFVSHTRREPALNEQEERLFGAYFPSEGALALVVKPNRFGVMEARVHLRQFERGAFEAMKPALMVDPQTVEPQERAWTGPRRERAPSAPLTMPAPAEQAKEARVAAAALPAKSGWRDRLLPAVMMLGLAATAGFVWRQVPLRILIASPAPAAPTSSPRPLQLLSLHAGSTPAGLRLSWSTGGWLEESDHAVVEFVGQGNKLAAQTLRRDDLTRGNLLLDLPPAAHEAAFSVFGEGKRLLARERVSWQTAPAVP